MKNLKKAAIIAGIFVAALTIKTHAAGNGKAKEQNASAASLYHALEVELIEEYLADQVEEAPEIETVKIFDSEDRLVYEGLQESEKGKSLIRKADFLMVCNHVSYYRIGE